MPSIMSQNLYQRVTSDVQIRKIEKIDPTKYQKSIMQVSDQQSRDKEYERSIVYLRTYIASLQAKLNTVVEELNNSYDTMLNEMLYKKADSKDTAKLLNNLPNASSLDLCGGMGQKYDPQALEITPYKTNVKNYQYNTMFGSKALDLSNYYDYGQTNNTTVARSYYEKGDPNASSPSNYHELGASVFGTLNYLWAWDLDRVNATYSTTKDSYVDADGNLHVPTGDPRAGASGIIEDSKLDIANGNSTTGGNANNLQVNVTALQPNRGVFLPNTEKPNLETIILKENFEERNTGPSSLPNGWLSTYAQSMLGNTWSSYGLQNYDGINQWGVDSIPPVTNNSLEPYFGLNPTNLKDTTHPLSTPLPQPTYSTETAGYLSSSSANFGNIRNVTYDDIVYEPHSTYRFDPNLVREHFDKAKAQTLSGGAVIDVNNTNTATDGLNLTATGNTALLNTVSYQPGLLSGPNGNNSITTNTSPGSLPYQAPQVVSGTTPADPGYGNAFGTAPAAATDIPRNALDINYANTPAGADSGLIVSTPKFDLSQFEDVVMNAKSYYEIESYIRKTFNQNSWTDSFLGIPYAWHWARTYSEYATPTAALKAIDTSIDPLTGTNTTFWKTNLPLEKYLGSLSASKDKNFLAVLLAIIVIVATGGAAAAFLVAGGLLLTFNPNSNDGRWDLIDFLMNNVPNNGSFFPPPNWTNNMFEYIGTSATQGRANMGMDFTLTGQNAGEWVDYRRGLTGEYSKEINNANSTKWQLDDMNIKAKGYSRGEMISPKMDFSKMESGYLEFYDKVETKKDGFVPDFQDFTKKQVYYSFDYDETSPSTATWNLLSSVSKTGVSDQKEWELNSGEIPCAGGEDNVRVKFVFDTRNNVSVSSNASGTNIVEYSDFNGWNVDNIKLVGRKAAPTDFYYYRQDLNSEFVTGAGAKLASLTETYLSGFNATTANSNESLRIISESPLTTEAQTTFMNNAPVSAPLATPTPVRFNMSAIDTTTPTTPVAFSIDNTAVNTNGSVTRTNSAPSGYKSISALSAIANTGDTTISVVTNPGLGMASTFYINGTSYTVDSAVGTTINFHQTLAPGVGLVAPSPTYDVGHMLMTPASLTPNPQTLTWDITNNTPSVAVPAGIAPASFNFVATDVKIGGTSVVMDPWANTVYDANNNPLVAPTPITMVTNSPANTTYTAGATTPSSVKTITGISVPAGTSNTTTITFDSSGEDVSTSGNVRTISVYKPITTLSVATNGSTLINVASSTGLAVGSIIYINGISYTVDGFESPFWWIGFTSTPSTQVYLTSAPPAGIGVATEVTSSVVTKTFVVNSTGANTAETIDISSLQGQSGLKAVITAASTNGLRSVSSANTDLSYWNINNFKIGTKIAPVNKLGKHTSYFETEPYAITNANSTLNFEYAALDDPSGLVNVTSRKIYASTNGGTTWTEVFSMPDTTNGIYRNGYIDLSTIAPPTSALKLKFESTIDVPDQIDILACSDIFDVKNIKINHTLSDNYNVAESTAPANTNRPNISFDPRGYNVEGRYTDVNGRTQISNTDFPMFSNTILTAVESDAARFQTYRGDTYAEWVGLNTKTPARVLDMLTGKVKPQLTGNFVISKDGLNNYYDTTKSGVPTDMYVDEALAINTSKIIDKVPTLDEINQGTTGWVNATANGNEIWIPNIASTKYEETINSTYNNMTIWGKKTFLLDPLSPLPTTPISTISANDDAYLYVNGFNVRSTAYEQVSDTTTTPTSTTLKMIDATDYKIGEIVMLNGITGTITAVNPAPAGANTITISGIPTNGPLSLPNIGTFDDLTIGKTPYTVYHTDPIKDASAVPLLITTVGDAPAQANKLDLTSVDHLKAGQTIYVNGQALLIETVTSTQFPLSSPLTGLGYITFSPLLTNKVISGSLLAYSYTDAGAATNVAGSAVTSTGTTPATQGLTNSNSTPISYHILPLLRKGFNTVGVKATEDKGDNENFNVTFSGITAMGDTKSGTGGASGIDTDTTWALKVSPNGYDGSNPFYTGPASGYTNDSASPLYQDEIDSLFKTEKVDKMETTVHFINQDPNGIGKLSLVKGIEVNVTGEPTVQTIKRNSFSTETRKDGGYVTTQLTKGFVNGLEQTGTGLALKFEPADMVGGSELNYMTDLSGKADINVFFDKKDSVVNDATMNITVQYIEDSNGDGKITGAELTELKTRIIGMQDTRNNKTLNPNSDAPATNIAGLTAVTGLRERYDFVETIGTTSTPSTINVIDTKNFAVGDYIRIEDPAIGHQAVQITSLSTSSGAGTITFTPNLQFTPTFTATTGPKVTSYRLLTDVDQAEAAKLYLGSNYTTLTAGNSPLTAAQTSLGYTKNTVTVNEQYLVASKGRSGGSIATGNENKITARLKQILDGDEFQEMLKYGLLDGIYIAATASDNRGDQIVGKLMLDWDWRKKKILVKQGSFSAIYKS